MAGNPIAFHVATITDTAGTIFDRAGGGFNTSPPSGAKCFSGRLTTADIRWRKDEDGTSPTASVGQTIITGEQIHMTITEAKATEFIRTGSTSGVIEGHFYPEPLEELRSGL